MKADIKNDIILSKDNFGRIFYMQFYKVYGKLITEEVPEEDGKSRRGLAREIAAKTAEFNGASKEKYCFLSDLGDEYITLGIITTQFKDPFEFAQDFTQSIGLQAKTEFPFEITFEDLQSLLSNSARQRLIDSTETILERFELDRISDRRGHGLEFGENILTKNADEDELTASAKKLFASDTLVPELKRIYAGSKSLCHAGHPVHYIVEADDRDVRRNIYKIILDALHANSRLESCRYSFLNFTPDGVYSKPLYESLYKMSEGGAVVVRYLANDASENQSNDSTDANERTVIETICEMAKKYRNKVLTVLCFPRNYNHIKTQFYEKLGSMSFIELREDYIIGDNARDFLASLAKEKRIRTNKALFANVKDDCAYLAPELQDIFDEWYNLKLKTTIYPQYKEVATARKESVKEKPRGSAYSELMEMIGLSEAKLIIKKALNYYKMQKLYEENGVKRDTPAMHMIFSGNPGTAKTTVARLFAQIMCENGLLSRGHLVEVGRGDLVGKFVGWTAQTVQKKFRDAMGGVLFIDEAYSLVDNRDGSFGDEAINTIVQEMENHRNNVVVIFAGYPDKMEKFLAKNPGLRSRIAFHVSFADYDSSELCQIADIISRKNGMKISRNAYGKLEKAFDAAKAEVDFGNGRYVRNIFEQAKLNQASRLIEKDIDTLTPDDITTITEEDIILPETAKPKKMQIGFC